MKRGFLFGLGSFLALAAVAGIIKAFMHGGTTGIVILFVAAPLGVLTFRRAMFASIGPRLHTVIGWGRGDLQTESSPPVVIKSRPKAPRPVATMQR